jgi:predicted O-methyltransferase YrrM
MTDIGEKLLSRMKPGPWKNPVIEGDEAFGSVMPGEAQLLYGIVRAMKPEIVLELGTAYGYSTLHLAQGCKDNGLGKVYTIEIDEKRYNAAIQNAEEVELTDWIKFHRIPPNELAIDLAFLDAVHRANDIIEYLEYIKPRLSQGGIVVVHDPLWDDHLRAAAPDWQKVFFYKSSFSGMAIMQFGG